jgi:DNA-binding MarR family transcriptional regulator
MTDEIHGVDAARDVVGWSRYFWDANGFDHADGLAIMASVGRLAQIIQSEMEKTLKPLGLGLSRYLLLMTLLLTKGGSRRMSRLGWHMMVHPTTVTVAVDQLEKEGLVKRRPHPTDRRATLIELTPAGRALAEKASALVADQNFGLPTLTKSETTMSLDALTMLRRKLGDVTADG